MIINRIKILSFLFFLASSLNGQDTNCLFGSNAILGLKVYTDIDSFLNDRGDQASKHYAEIQYFMPDSTEITIPAKMKVRGNFRRKPENCNFPNYSFFFNNEDVNNTLFQEQKKIKVVSHCNGGVTGLNEYLVYKLYQIHSPYAYQVKLVLINYFDLKGEYMPFAGYGFILENTNKMGERLGGEILKQERINKNELNVELLIINHLFQMLIGNTDWDFEMMKNYKYLKLDNSDEFIPIPYDFDLAEVVDANYPTYESIFGKEPIDRRKPRCLEVDKKLFFKVVYDMKSKKMDVYNLYLNFPYLPNIRKVEILDYYEDFYRKLNRKRKLYREFIQVCREKEKRNK